MFSKKKKNLLFVSFWNDELNKKENTKSQKNYLKKKFVWIFNKASFKNKLKINNVIWNRNEYKGNEMIIQNLFVYSENKVIKINTIPLWIFYMQQRIWLFHLFLVTLAWNVEFCIDIGFRVHIRNHVFEVYATFELNPIKLLKWFQGDPIAKRTKYIRTVWILADICRLLARELPVSCACLVITSFSLQNKSIAI